MTRLLITGGSSYLGQHLAPAATAAFDLRYTFHSHNPLELSQGRQLDVRDRAAVHRLVSDFRPDVVIHTAGSNRGPDMENVIRLGAENVCEAAKACDARLIHISTDVVFDGASPPYRESDPPNPIHDYGRAKARAEQIVATLPNHVIVRTSLIYGLEIADHSTKWMKRALLAGEPVTLFENQIRNPVWADTLSQACLELAGSDFRGILNVAGNQTMSRADFGLRLLDWWGVTERSTLTIGPSSSKWPLDCRLDLSLAREVLETPLLGVDEVLRNARASRAAGHLT
jgi:dTDP-4-dehydrorhamnose reductase